ncbi:MAG: DinB family protein [Chloroflexota bacterium]
MGNKPDDAGIVPANQYFHLYREALMNGVDVQLAGLIWAHELQTMVTADLTQEQAAWIPPGTANPIAAQYAHSVCAEDGVIQTVLQGKTPLFASDWAGRTGISDPQIMATPEWSRSVTVDLPALREYATAVTAASRAYIAGLTDEDLGRELDLTAFGLGRRTVGLLLQANLIAHIHNMVGEISALKGAQGAKGYPF